MRFVINAVGLLAWGFTALLLFSGINEIGSYEPDTFEYIQATASFDAAIPTMGFCLVFGLGCFLVGALIKRNSEPKQ